MRMHDFGLFFFALLAGIFLHYYPANNLTLVGRLCQGLLKGLSRAMSRACHGVVKGLSRACQGLCQGLVKGLSRGCQGVVKGLSRGCQGLCQRLVKGVRLSYTCVRYPLQHTEHVWVVLSPSQCLALSERDAAPVTYGARMPNTEFGARFGCLPALPIGGQRVPPLALLHANGPRLRRCPVIAGPWDHSGWGRGRSRMRVSGLGSVSESAAHRCSPHLSGLSVGRKGGGRFTPKGRGADHGRGRGAKGCRGRYRRRARRGVLHCGGDRGEVRATGRKGHLGRVVPWRRRRGRCLRAGRCGLRG